MGNSLWRWFRKDCNHFLLQAVNLQIIFSNLQHCWATHTFFCSFYQSHCQLMWDLCQVIMANRRTGDFIPYRTPLFSHIVLFEKKKIASFTVLSGKTGDDCPLNESLLSLPVFSSASGQWFSLLSLGTEYLSGESLYLFICFCFPTSPLPLSGIETLSDVPCSSRLCPGFPLFQSPTTRSHYLLLYISHNGFSTLFLASLQMPLSFYVPDQSVMPAGVTKEWRLGFSVSAYTPSDNLPP